MSTTNGVNGQGSTQTQYEDWESPELPPEEEGVEGWGDEEWGESSFEGPEGEAQNYNGTQAQQKLDEMKQTLIEQLRSDTTPDEMKVELRAYLKEIESIHVSDGDGPIPPETANQIDALAAKIYGEAAGGAEGEEEGEEGSSLKDLEAQINALPDDQNKQDLLLELETVKNTQSIDPDRAAELLDALMQKVNNAAIFGSKLMTAAQQLGIDDPNQLKDILARHNMDINSLDPTSPQMGELLADPEFAAICPMAQAVTEDLEAVSTSYGDRITKMDEVNSAVATYNTSTVAITTSTPKSAPPPICKTGAELLAHTSELDKTYLNNLTKLATDSAAIISALTGTTVTADSQNPGCISVNGTSMNMINDPTSQMISMSSDLAVHWGELTATAVEVDADDDGQTPIEQWMLDANYPMHNFDDDVPATARPGEKSSDVGEDWFVVGGVWW